jgi:hypothetical protein
VYLFFVLFVDISPFQFDFIDTSEQKKLNTTIPQAQLLHNPLAPRSPVISTLSRFASMSLCPVGTYQPLIAPIAPLSHPTMPTSSQQGNAFVNSKSTK